VIVDTHICFSNNVGILLSEGSIDGVDANPQQAAVWWRRCVDEHGHIHSLYELATACYLGDGIVEDAPMAVSLFRRAAHLGHAGAAYMLGECLLNGVGTERDRTDALEWLVTAAELGHRGAQERVLMILNVDYGDYNVANDVAKQRQLEETIKWINYEEDIESYDPKLEPLHKAVNIERRFTIGGGSRNPVVVARRKSIVEESRNEH
jgi:Sel1 repeat